jgi:DNA repair ATPase RecN
VAERKKTERHLDTMDADALARLARELDEDADELRAHRDQVARALGARIEAGDVPADMRPAPAGAKEG